MDLQKAKVLLEKINALHRSMSIDENDIANIEKDLMLTYIRQLYETFLDLPTVTNKVKKVSASPTASMKRETVVPEPKTKPKEPKPKVSTPAYKPPRIIEIPPSLKEEPRKAAPASKPTPKAAPVKTAKPTPVAPAPPPKPTVKKSTALTGKMAGLFEFKEAKELSEKLSASPIKNLTQAFALNDKLLYANELFGKELQAFNVAITQLNKLSSFEEAQNQLVEMAQQHQWTHKDRSETAKEFIKIVKRRFP